MQNVDVNIEREIAVEVKRGFGSLITATNLYRQKVNPSSWAAGAILAALEAAVKVIEIRFHFHPKKD